MTVGHVRQNHTVFNSSVSCSWRGGSLRNLPGIYGTSDNTVRMYHPSIAAVEDLTYLVLDDVTVEEPRRLFLLVIVPVPLLFSFSLTFRQPHLSCTIEGVRRKRAKKNDKQRVSVSVTADTAGGLLGRRGMRAHVKSVRNASHVDSRSQSGCLACNTRSPE